jgi:GT2 family glycosyltransferase
MTDHDQQFREGLEPGLARVGVVMIGRNEGQRLCRCLASIPIVGRAVYVDSGSIDGSVDLARSRGFEVVELDTSAPFGAGRARNAGIDLLTGTADDSWGTRPGVVIEFVLVVDGDCELVPGFIEAALETMRREPRIAVVCGRRRERDREASRYHRLCDMEWDTPVGLTEACGGDALLRVSALERVGCYDPAVVAGEEPELCWRLRRAGWNVRRIDCAMTMHDAAMTRFSEWWKRAVRAGYAYADLYARHRYWGREVRSCVFYALLVPILAMATGRAYAALGFAWLVTYLVLYLRVRQHRMARGDIASDAGLYARYCVVAKFAQLVGLTRWSKDRLLGQRSEIIEYKGPAAQSGGAGAVSV